MDSPSRRPDPVYDRGMRAILAGSLCTALAFACGGGSGGGGSSGVPSGSRLVELDDGQRVDLCEFLVDVLGPERMVTCGPDDIRTVGGEDPQECIADLTMIATNNPGCEITVGQYEACARAVAAQSDQEICGDTIPAACSPLFSPNCFGG